MIVGLSLAWPGCDSSSQGAGTEREVSAGECQDGIDNDADGNVDCDDTDCQGYIFCTTLCAGGTVQCGSLCIDVNNDPLHCGACNQECAAGELCSARQCALTCLGGTTECAGSCVNTLVDPFNCGTCGIACGAGEVCSAGQCTFQCAGGSTDCGGRCVDTNLDPAHCGGCNNACPAGEVCVSGQCGLNCAGGTSLCGNACVDITTDPANCGGCSSACLPEEVCSAGNCALQCVGGSTNCGGLCVDTQVDPAHCGFCSNACAVGEVCSAGNCGLQCVGGTTQCGPFCVDTQNDPMNCGVCGSICAAGDVCSAGNCGVQCTGGSTQCGSFCVDTQLDPANCGSCGNLCLLGEVCSGGLCGLQCTGGSTQCGSFCVDPQNDPANCGACGNACPPGEICTSGICGLQCFGGTTQCGPACVDTDLDPANCGTCGNACGGSQSCSAGICVSLCGGLPCAPGDVIWSARYGDGSNDYVHQVATDSGGNIYLAGYHQGTIDLGGGPLSGATNYNILLAKLSPEGTHIWSQAFGNTDGRGYDVTIDNNGDVILTGIMQGTVDFGGGNLVSAGSWDAFIAKFDSDGNHIWSQRFGDVSDNRMNYSAVDSANNIIVTGFFQGTLDVGAGPMVGAGSWDGFVAKFTSAGVPSWSLRFGDGSDQRGRGVGVDPNDNIFLASYYQGAMNLGGAGITSAGGWDSYAAKLDPLGNQVWLIGFGDVTTNQYILDMVMDPNGSLIMGGYFQGSWDFGGPTLTSAGSYDAFMAKLDNAGNHVWSARYGDAGDDRFWGIGVDSAGNALAHGHFMGTLNVGGGPLNSAGNWDSVVAKWDPSGNHLWSVSFGDGSGDVGLGIAADPTGRVIAAGYFAGQVNPGGTPLVSAGLDDAYLVLFAP